jgi:hydrogenase expression/formation protein HypC
MCMAVPMRVLMIDGCLAQCEAQGARRAVNLLLLDGLDIRPGDHLVVHGGTAIERISAERAAEAWALYAEMLAAADVHEKGPHAAGLAGAADA